MQNSKSLRYLLSGGFLLLCISLLLGIFTRRSLEEVAGDASAVIAQKARLGSEAIASWKSAEDVGPELQKLYLEERTGLYFFEGDSLSAWNNARLPFHEKPGFFKDSSGFVKLRHGNYFYMRRSLGAGRSGLAVCLVKPQYELQNNYLSNDFSGWTNIPREVELVDAVGTGIPVSYNGHTLFKLKSHEDYFYNKRSDNFAALFFFSGLILLLGALLNGLKHDLSEKRFLYWLLLILVTRTLMLYFKLPEFLYRTALYDVSLFGNARSLINGLLGDMLLNAILAVFLAAAVLLYFSKTDSRNNKAEVFLQSLLLLAMVRGFNASLKSLVSNSTINFDFLNVLNLQLPALAGLGVLCLFCLAFFISAYRLIQIVKGDHVRSFLLLTGITVLVCTVNFIFSGSKAVLLELSWPLIFVWTLFLLMRVLRVSITPLLGTQVLLMSLLTSVMLNTYIDSNEEKELELLSYKLSERQDPVLESEFTLLPQKIEADANLRNLFMILPASSEGVEMLLKQRYFGGYFDRYNVDLVLFNDRCEPVVPSKDGLLNNLGYFEDQISLQSDSSSAEGLFFVRNYHKNTRYFAKMPVGPYKLYVRLEAKQFEELGTFPDLLLDRSQQKHEKLKTFSHAVYRDQQLSSHYGELRYPFFLQDSLTLATTYPNYLSHFFKPEENTEIIISEKARNINHFFTLNSYLLLFFSMITFVCFLFYDKLFTGNLSSPSLTRRIQSIVIVLLLVSMSAIGYTSARLVSQQFENNNKRELEEKTQVIISELSSNFSQEQIFDESRRELVNLKLKEYARLFNTPISLFNSQGRLFNTSEPKLYDLGLSAGLLNPIAYARLSKNLSSAEAVYEKAGTLSYLSYYTPVFGQKRQLLGFVNLPYFARQSALVNELSGIISAFVNVYVLLFVISLLAGITLSSYITQPLRLIKQQISNISLGRKNEKISWQSNDEIGRLVSEYNDMLLKLENSAQLLAQSERESAWREMAKQVAHEIKNPLTPMKLNIQYLQHLQQGNENDFKEKFPKISLAIIEQIDSLANIAEEFSHLARLPAAAVAEVNLSEVISASVQIFNDEEKAMIKNETIDQELLIKGDRDQCLRVFNNLLKNAVQALEGVEEPRIIISSEIKNDSVIIMVKDNGCGIPEELKPKMFSPNFTTKNTGSGLGLAMVANIMEGFGGKIWFESEQGKGATFYLEFRVK